MKTNDMKKKMLLLGGSHGQLPAIYEAKRRGLYTILCDYLPGNPGRKLVDEYHNISTTNKDEILSFALKKKIDAVLAYASDPATPTAAYVSEKMNLPGNSCKSVQLLSEKDRFRNLQKLHSFNVPDYKVLSEKECKGFELKGISLPVVVKPVDASDTKGVYKVSRKENLADAMKQSAAFSKSNRIIIEEYIDCDYADFHGDAFFLNGEMVFCMLGDRLFNSISNPLKPSVVLYPSRLHIDIISKVQDEAALIVKKSGLKNGPVNIEARINNDGKIYIMEIGPRSGGVFTPQTIYYSSGVDMLKATFDFLLNEPVNISPEKFTPSVGCGLHVNREGTFIDITINPGLKKYLTEKHLFIKKGDTVKPFSKPGSTFGALIFSFPGFTEANSVIEDLYSNIQNSIKLK